MSYNAARFDQFRAAYAYAGAGLHLDVIDSYSSAYAGEDSRAPTDMHAAINAAGRILRRNPDTQLAAKTVELPDELRRDMVASVLGTIVNTSIERPNTLPASQSYTGEDMPAVHVCARAEPYFSKLTSNYQAIIEGRPPYDPATRSQVIMDEDGPIALRKGIAQPSSLALREVSVNGVHYPAGSLLRIQLHGDTADYSTGMNFNGPADPVDASRVTGAAFMRLSTFAHNPEDRAELYPTTFTGLERTPFSSELRDIEHSISVDEIAEAADTAVRLLHAEPLQEADWQI